MKTTLYSKTTLISSRTPAARPSKPTRTQMGFMKWLCSHLERKYKRTVDQYCTALAITPDTIEAPAVSVFTHLARVMGRDRHVSLESLSKFLGQTFPIQRGQDSALHAQLVFRLVGHLSFLYSPRLDKFGSGDTFVSGDLFAEILCSYSLIFGQSRHAHRAFRHDFTSVSLRRWSSLWRCFQRRNESNNIPSSILKDDSILFELCSRDWADVAVYEELDITNVKNVYSAAEDFPYLGGRLAVLDDFIEAWEPDSWHTLWNDGRNLNRHYTLRFIVITCALTLILGMISFAPKNE
ncbi:hypothetical protein B0T16DRAFT_459124 [Cercophora newfieldiana]|uniref:Uncharacterized protein n=1 Tax=Cercophora newfieldiana TaxID=92897 RepID=A0AA40CLK9_9PEZI|nr:hypothetical protein B0T16DRAFT_459124 [Cercophora newfieldiana]